MNGCLFARLRLAKADDALALGPLTALLEQLDALEALEDVALLLVAATGGVERGMEGHDALCWLLKVENLKKPMR